MIQLDRRPDSAPGRAIHGSAVLRGAPAGRRRASGGTPCGGPGWGATWAAARAIPALLPCVCSGLFAGCHDATTVVRGTGAVIQERRTLKPLTGIELLGGMDVSVSVSGGGPLPESSGSDTIVWIEGAENLIEYVETNVRGSTLELRFRDGVLLDPRPSIEVRISELESLAAVGSGAVAVDGIGAGPHPPQALFARIAGSVDVRASGAVERLELLQAGSGSFDFSRVRARRLEHEGTGSGDVSAYVTGSVKTTLRGSGSLTLYGPARVVEESIEGSGRVIRPDGSRRVPPARGGAHVD